MKIYYELQSQTGQYLAGVPAQAVEDGFEKAGPSYLDRVGNLTEGIENVITDHPIPALIAGATAGLLIGVGAEYRANKKVLSNREALANIHADLVDDVVVTRKRRIGTSVLSIAAIGGLGFGLANTALWINPDSEQNIEPSVDVVIDKSGATITQNNQESAVAVRSLVNQIDASMSEYSLTGLVASSGDVIPMSMSDAAELKPFGHAPVADAFQLSIDGVSKQIEDLQIGDEIQNNAIIVITDGNTIDGTLTPEQIESAKSPVYVFDVAETSQAETSLRTITELTGGEYYGRDDLDTVDERKDIVSDISSEVESADNTVEQDSNWPIRIAMFGATGLAFATWAMNRAKLTSNIMRKRRTTKPNAVDA